MKQDKVNFYDMVYQVVKLIPEGRVSTYGAIAAYLGSKGSARMVGWAMNASHQQENIPAHRVVNRFGMLTGKSHFPDSSTMRRLLEKEGATIEQDQIKDFERVFWDPAKHLIP
ncbi:MGMT family protein [Cyclobacterium jeungdonense]|uniref:MGMT family protein n=1 Tax=Cyclobacterium jeungdonense TaxID=708087 RepID=A0ABT8C8W0_9BACT|nr:MGMT family protein [Cyclobacterium jeungdonense]MDN3689215.1 MGMT family protein [Cyclobacterium jeungdonense]